MNILTFVLLVTVNIMGGYIIYKSLYNKEKESENIVAENIVVAIHLDPSIMASPGMMIMEEEVSAVGEDSCRHCKGTGFIQHDPNLLKKLPELWDKEDQS